MIGKEDDFYADPNNNQLPTFEELVNASGLQPNEKVSVQLESNPGEILIHAYPNNGTCSKGENLMISIKDEVIARWQ